LKLNGIFANADLPPGSIVKSDPDFWPGFCNLERSWHYQAYFHLGVFGFVDHLITEAFLGC
jgi:hypothetical protein